MDDNELVEKLKWLKAAGFGKSYPDGRWMFRPSQFLFGNEYRSISERIRPVDELAEHVDERPLMQLADEAKGILKQIRLRAHCGDEGAIQLYAAIAHNTVGFLDELAGHQPEKLKAVAEAKSRWPVLISLNPQDIKIATERIKILHVGERATTPTKPGQRVDRRNIWTDLACMAVEQCEDARTVIPSYEEYAVKVGATQQQAEVQAWNTPMPATAYYLPDGDVIVIADWQRKCLGLTKPVTKENFDLWWQAVQGCLLEYWFTFPDAYARALEQIEPPGAAAGVTNDDRRFKGDRQRNLALTSVRHALESLFGVR